MFSVWFAYCWFGVLMVDLFALVTWFLCSICCLRGLTALGFLVLVFCVCWLCRCLLDSVFEFFCLPIVMLFVTIAWRLWFVGLALLIDVRWCLQSVSWLGCGLLVISVYLYLLFLYVLIFVASIVGFISLFIVFGVLIAWLIIVFGSWVCAIS